VITRTRSWSGPGPAWNRAGPRLSTWQSSIWPEGTGRRLSRRWRRVSRFTGAGPCRSWPCTRRTIRCAPSPLSRGSRRRFGVARRYGPGRPS